MIRVKKIAHATYETPDLDRQVEYYTDILGLTLVAKEKDAAYLASTIDHHSVVLRKGEHAQLRAARLPGRARRRPRRVREADRGARHQDPAQERSRALDRRDDHLRGPEGHRDGGVQARRVLAARASRPRASCRTSSATSRSSSKTSRRTTDFYCDVLGFRVSDWMGDFFSFLRCGTDHHTINLMQTRGGPALPHRLRAARLGPHADRLRLSSASTATSCCGARAATASATICSPITARRTA